MKKIIHVCADIQGLLNMYKGKSLAKTMTDTKTGKVLSDTEARQYLHDCLAKGWKVIPFGDCDNFDYQTGCKGHEVKESEGEK